MNKKVRCLVIGLKGLPAFGGAAAVGEGLLKSMSNSYSFTVLSVDSHTKIENKQVYGIPQVIFKSHGRGALNTLLYYLNSLWYAMTHNFDLIHIHHAESGFVTPFLRLKYNVVVTFHGVYNYNDPKFSSIHNWFFRVSERLNVRFANEVVSVSKPDVEYIKRKYGREILYIPNGISFTSKMADLLYNKRQMDYILFAAGRIYDIKGLHLLLDAMNQFNDGNLLKIAGDIDQVQSYKLRIEGLVKCLNTEFVGLIKDKDELMRLVSEAKLFVFPSLTEAMSMMLLEVVSMKTPIIASDIASNKSIFTDEEVLFFRSEDSHDLKEKLIFAYQHPQIMKEKAERAYIKLSLNYTWDSVASLYDLLYKKNIN